MRNKEINLGIFCNGLEAVDSTREMYITSYPWLVLNRQQLERAVGMKSQCRFHLSGTHYSLTHPMAFPLYFLVIAGSVMRVGISTFLQRVQRAAKISSGL